MKAIQVLHGLSAVIFVTVGVAAGPFHVEGAGQFRSTRARVARASLEPHGRWLAVSQLRARDSIT